MQVAISADLGGTLLRTAAVTPAHEVIHQTVLPVGSRRGNAAIAPLLRGALAETYDQVRRSAMEPVGVGLAMPGLVDTQQGVIRYSANLDLHDLAVRAIVQEVVPYQVAVENDVRAAAWGEFRWGAGRGTQYMAYLSVGTGIAAAVICRGQLHRGAGGAAGELGHVPVVPNGAPCRCGGRGCLETVAGGWGIAQRAAARIGSPDLLTAEAVFEAAAAGDPVASAVIGDAGEFLGRAAVLLMRLWDPDRLVLGGGLFFSGSPLVDAVDRAVQAGGLARQVSPTVHRGAFERDAGLIGGACLVLSPP